MARRYDIEKLLREGAQPFENLTEDQKLDLRSTITEHGKRLDKMPVHLNGEERLYDGHQRLWILIALGRKTIGESEVIHNYKLKGIQPTHLEAIRINRNRRHLTGEALAAAYWDLVRRWNMSQTLIAETFGTSQQAVSKLMKKYPAPDMEGEQTTIGADGRAYKRTIDPPRPKATPWQPDGVGMVAVQKLRRRLRSNPPVGLTDSEKSMLADEMSWLRSELTDTIQRLTGNGIIDVSFVDEELPPAASGGVS